MDYVLFAPGAFPAGPVVSRNPEVQSLYDHFRRPHFSDNAPLNTHNDATQMVLSWFVSRLLGGPLRVVSPREWRSVEVPRLDGDLWTQARYVATKLRG